MSDRKIPERRTSGYNVNRTRSYQRNREDYRIPDLMDYKNIDKIKSSRLKKRKKKKNTTYNVLIAVLCASIIIVFMLCFMLGFNYLSEETSGKKSNNENQNVLSSDGESIIYLSIDQESFTAVSGMEIQLTATVDAAIEGKYLWWKSNNEEVAYVDENGMLYIFDEGIAAVTVVSGDYSDSIAVEVVSDKDNSTKLGLPMYELEEEMFTEGAEEVTSETGVKPVTPSINEETVNSDSIYESSSDELGKTDNPESSIALEEPAEEVSEAITEAETEVGTESVEEVTTATQVTTKDTVAGGKIDTAELMSVLTANGFTKYMDDIGVFNADGEYLGEIIIEEDKVHVYIKARTEQFDVALKNMLSYLLPEKSEEAWEEYISATSDKTINMGARNVRIIMAENNSHSQIIVYNR